VKRLRIAHLTSVHQAEDVRIFHKEARTLAAAGHEVFLVAPGQFGEVTKEGVHFRPVKPPSSRLERILHTGSLVRRRALALDADVYHIHDPELIVQGVLLKLRGKSVIYDVHEDLPKQVLTKTWIPGMVRPLIAFGTKIVEKWAFGIFDELVAATPSIKRRMPRTKGYLVQNFPLLDELMSPNTVPYSDRPPNLVYMGGLSPARGAEEMVRMLSLLPPELGARLKLATKLSETYRQFLSRFPGWEFVDYLGWRSREELRDLLGSVRLGLVLFHPVPNHVEAQPNKLFEYMSAGLPVVASDFPLWREIVEGTGCGILVDPRDISAIAEAVTWILRNPAQAEEMGRRGVSAVKERYNWDHEARTLLQCYEHVARIR